MTQENPGIFVVDQSYQVELHKCHGGNGINMVLLSTLGDAA